MRRTTFVMGAVAVVLLSAGHESQAQRGGGRGGGGGGGARPSAGGLSGASAGARPAATGAYGGAGVSPRPATPTAPAQQPAGTRTTNSGSGSYTTQRGTTIDYAGAGAKGTTPGGVNYGKGVGGVQVTTPGGATATKVGTAGGAAGPGGNAVGGRSGVTSGTTASGTSFGSAYKGGVAVGPQGAAAAGGRVGTATNAAGQTVSGASRAGAAVGPYGAVAGGTRVAGTTGPGGTAVAGSRTTAGRSAYGTYYASRSTMVATGNTVRANFRAFAYQYPALTARWIGPTWRPITWAALSSYGGYPAEPVSYDYGESVVYSESTVTVNGAEVPAEQFDQQATDIATAGQEAKADPKEGEWKSLGVFAMVAEGEEKSNNIFQLSVNKDGVIRGEYYNALTDTTEPVYGSVDKKTQRAAWTVADKKTPVYEAGIVNLTQDEATLLVHYGKDKRQQFLFVRLPEPDAKQPEGEKK